MCCFLLKLLVNHVPHTDICSNIHESEVDSKWHGLYVYILGVDVLYAMFRIGMKTCRIVP